jgi:hypothetical protein
MPKKKPNWTQQTCAWHMQHFVWPQTRPCDPAMRCAVYAENNTARYERSLMKDTQHPLAFHSSIMQVVSSISQMFHNACKIKTNTYISRARGLVRSAGVRTCTTVLDAEVFGKPSGMADALFVLLLNLMRAHWVSWQVLTDCKAKRKLRTLSFMTQWKM